MSIKVSENFRQSMGWLHTWFGIALSAVLFAVFWTGTLTVFDQEIDQWMKPELRIPVAQDVSLDEIALPRLAEVDLQEGSLVWVGPPRERTPFVQLFYDDIDGVSHEELLDPYTGEVLDLTDSDAGSEFFFHFHYMLHIPGILGYYIVGLAAVGMMALVVSGIFIHRKIFQEFFTFRPRKKLRRSVLDFHNLTAVVALPFHFIIPFSGFLILVATYFPWSMAVPFDGNGRQMDNELAAYEKPKIDAAGVPGEAITTLDGYMARAEEIWRSEEGEGTSDADWIAIFNVNDANSYVVVERFHANRRVTIGPDQIVFDPRSDEIIDRFDPQPIHSVNNWIEGLHWIQFDHWPLRWLYFFAGLSGCAMIGSGLAFWIQARIRKEQYDPASVRIVRAISVGSITGIIAASAAFLLANRLLPKVITFTETPRHDLEIWVFFAVWAASFFHAVIRGKSAWKDQAFVIAFLAALAVLLNWITTGDHPIAALSASLWSIAIMDLLLIAGSIIAFMAAIKLRKNLNNSATKTVSASGFEAEEEPEE